MKLKLLFIFLFCLITQFSFAQVGPNEKVFLEFKDTSGEVNVDGKDALEMLKSYLSGKTNLVLTDKKEDAKYTFVLSVVEKNMGNRKGKLNVTDNTTNKVVYETKWVTGTSNAFYGYSGTRHAIGKLVKDQILEEYPKISAE